MHDDEQLKLRPMVATSAAATAAERVRVSPLLWPLVGYLGAGTVVLFGVTQLERLSVAIAPWPGRARRWHEASAGWMALYPVTVPLLLLRVALLLALAIPARGAYWLGSAVRRFVVALADAWHFVHSMVRRALHAARAAVVRLLAWLRPLLAEAMRAVRQTAEATVRQVRAALARWFSSRQRG